MPAAPAPSSSQPAPAPAAGAKPGPDNTGVPAGTSLTPSGGLRITQANTVVDARDISGTVYVEASNVTIRSSRIHGSSSDDFGVLVRSGSVQIIDSEISGFQNGIAGNGWTATRVDLHSLTDDGVSSTTASRCRTAGSTT